MKRVFTKNKKISFVDYNNVLTGNEILKNTLSKGKFYNGNNLILNGNVLTNYSNYSTFLKVSGAYFRRFTTHKNCFQAVSVDDGGKSSVVQLKYDTNNAITDNNAITNNNAITSNTNINYNINCNINYNKNCNVCVDTYKEYDKCTPLFIDTDCCKTITQNQNQNQIDNIIFDSCDKLSLYPYGMFNDTQTDFYFPQRLIIPDDKCSKICQDKLCELNTDNDIFKYGDNICPCPVNERLFIN